MWSWDAATERCCLVLPLRKPVPFCCKEHSQLIAFTCSAFGTPPPHGNVLVWSCILPKCVCVFSCVWLFPTPWTVACQAPLSMDFSRQKYWSGLLFPFQRDLSNTGTKPVPPGPVALAGRFFTIVKNGSARRMSEDNRAVDSGHFRSAWNFSTSVLWGSCLLGWWTPFPGCNHSLRLTLGWSSFLLPLLSEVLGLCYDVKASIFCPYPASLLLSHRCYSQYTLAFWTPFEEPNQQTWLKKSLNCS